LEAEDLIFISFLLKKNIFCSFTATTRASEDYVCSLDVMSKNERHKISGKALNHFFSWKKGSFRKLKKFSENFQKFNDIRNGIGNGHEKILDEFVNLEKSSQDLEIEKNIYILNVIHSVYNSINSKKNYIKNKESILGK